MITLQGRRRWGGGGGAWAPQVLGYQLTLFGPRGADYARHITTAPPHIFEIPVFHRQRKLNQEASK